MWQRDGGDLVVNLYSQRKVLQGKEEGSQCFLKAESYYKTPGESLQIDACFWTDKINSLQKVQAIMRLKAIEKEEN